MVKNILFSGFGGQGVLFMGKQLAKTAMHNDLQVSWLPSYGPEMRGGAANCSVIISDSEIGSPLVTNPDILVTMNIPSFDKFEPAVKAGGLIIADSTLIPKKSERTDIEAHYIPATQLASDNKLPGGANVIILGQLLKITKLFDIDTFIDLLVSSIPAKKTSLIENNKRALRLGYEFECK